MNTETPEIEVEEKQKLNLALDVKEVSACQRHVTVTIPREDIERYYQKQFDDLAPKAEVPGFRIGRAPRNLIESKFRKQVGEQVKGSLLMDSLTQISDNEEFSAISEPELDYEQVNIPDEGPLTFEFDIEVRPEFDMPNYDGIKVSQPDHEFSDSDVDDQIAKMASQFSDLVPIDEPVAEGDVIICNLTSTFEGNVIATSEEVQITVLPTLSLADGNVEGFDKLLVGTKAEETKTAQVEVSEFADNEELQGKTIELAIEVLDVKRIEKQTSEEVAEKMGIESVDELRTLIRQSLEERLKYAQRETVRDQISTSLTESADWELPPELLKRQSRRELSRNVMEMRSSGFSEQEIRARENSLRQNILDKTERLLKEHFILERIAEEEKVEDHPQDYDLEIAKVAAQMNDSPRRVRARLERNGQMDSLRNMIIERKVIELITEKAEISTTPYDLPKKQEVEAIDFSISTAVKISDIPEAKYDDGGTPLTTGSSKEIE
ncbi:trigger factor [bacterium]|nr:trigger factor [bacterium]